MHILKATSDILKLSNPIQNVVFADSCGFYDTILPMLSSVVCIPHASTFKIDDHLANVDSLNILKLFCIM